MYVFLWTSSVCIMCQIFNLWIKCIGTHFLLSVNKWFIMSNFVICKKDVFVAWLGHQWTRVCHFFYHLLKKWYAQRKMFFCILFQNHILFFLVVFIDSHEISFILNNSIKCQWLVTGRWYSPGTLVSSTVKTDATIYNWNIFENGVKHHNLPL